MSPKEYNFQPGAILHDAICGAFRTRGISFERWCKENDIPAATARNATYGQSKGRSGQELLERLVHAAGHEIVRAAYADRTMRHASDIGRENV